MLICKFQIVDWLCQWFLGVYASDFLETCMEYSQLGFVSEGLGHMYGFRNEPESYLLRQNCDSPFQFIWMSTNRVTVEVAMIT